MFRQITMEGGYNIRDLGEFPTESGHSIQRYRLIRSGNLDKLSLSAHQQIMDYGVKTIIDLRDEWEAADFPNPLLNSTAVKCLNLPLIGNHLSHNANWQAETHNYSTLAELYIKYLEQCQFQISTIVTAIADSTFATLFYCHAGKDRTGIITALLLGVAGVPHALIAEDYALSGLEITHLISQWRDYAVQQQQDMNLFEINVASTSETMLTMLSYLTHRYGSITNYLIACGISHSQLEHLRTRLTQ